MSAHIKLSRKAAEALVEECEGRTFDVSATRAVAELRAALARAKRTKPMRRARVEGIRADRAAKNEETAEIRRAVFARAADRCELCHLRLPSELHHAHGRVRVPQAIENCLALCTPCHRDLTRNFPSAAYWMTAQIAHFRRHGFNAEAERMLARIESRALSAASAEVGKGASR